MQWRLIPLLKASGKIQMALDTWLLDQHQRGLHPPTLRFYIWNPPAISVGYHQKHWSAYWHDLTFNGCPVELVRRPTGGRAVLHQGDLTYAVITSGLTGNRIQAYQRICEFLVQGWRSLGVELHYGQAGRGYIHNPNCFGTATGADLVLPDGAKLIGSAQLRRGNAILQHGSIQLQTDPDLFETVFGVRPNRPTLPANIQSEGFMETIIDALVKAAIGNFGIDLNVQPLSESEWQTVLTQAELEPQIISSSSTKFV